MPLFEYWVFFQFVFPKSKFMMALTSIIATSAIIWQPGISSVRGPFVSDVCNVFWILQSIADCTFKIVSCCGPIKIIRLKISHSFTVFCFVVVNLKLTRYKDITESAKRIYIRSCQLCTIPQRIQCTTSGKYLEHWSIYIYIEIATYYAELSGWKRSVRYGLGADISLPHWLETSIWNLAHKSGHRAQISGNIVWYDAPAPLPEVLLSCYLVCACAATLKLKFSIYSWKKFSRRYNSIQNVINGLFSCQFLKLWINLLIR